MCFWMRDTACHLRHLVVWTDQARKLDPPVV